MALHDKRRNLNNLHGQIQMCSNPLNRYGIGCRFYRGNVLRVLPIGDKMHTHRHRYGHIEFLPRLLYLRDIKYIVVDRFRGFRVYRLWGQAYLHGDR